MKKIILLLFFLSTFVFATTLVAQTASQIAVVNSTELLDALPEKAVAVASLENMNKSYKEELDVMQKDYNKKYSDFISYQTSMAENIRLRRMQELYELERHVNDFMKVAQGDIDSKEKELINPLRQKVKEAIAQIGIERGFICIYDLANPAIAFVTPEATDITAMAKQKLGVKMKSDQ